MNSIHPSTPNPSPIGECCASGRCEPPVPGSARPIFFYPRDLRTAAGCVWICTACAACVCKMHRAQRRRHRVTGSSFALSCSRSCSRNPRRREQEQGQDKDERFQTQPRPSSVTATSRESIAATMEVTFVLERDRRLHVAEVGVAVEAGALEVIAGEEMAVAALDLNSLARIPRHDEVHLRPDIIARGP